LDFFTDGLILAQMDGQRADRGPAVIRFLAEFWPILVPASLGLAAVYLLLPRVRRYPPLCGGLLGGLAIVVTGWWLIHFRSVSPEAVLFYAFAGLAVLFAGLMVTQTNPVHAALSFALVVLSTCGLFLLLAAPFLMAATIIIYAGAIIVTFLFVIMLVQQHGPSSADQRSREPFLASMAGFVLLAAVLSVLLRNYQAPRGQQYARQLQDLLELARKVKTAKDTTEIRAILGDGRDFFKEFLDLVSKQDDFLPGQAKETKLKVETHLDLAQLDWSTKDEHWTRPETKASEVKRHLAMVYKEGRLLQVRLNSPGFVVPDPDLPVSPFSTGPSPEPVRNPQGLAQLPAENVASVGRALFTDYLVAVLLAGLLLLVATIGAIVIAVRRMEALR
jgi:NADH:ubiquinone oxidoreductase subunit 6 (subunit J)